MLLPATAHSDSAAATHPSGITTRVSSVDTITPEASEIAMPWKIGSKKITDDPQTSASAVIRMGRVRVLHDVITASTTVSPCWIRWTEKSTSRIELRTMMPARAIQPIIDVAVNSPPHPIWKNSMCAGMIPSNVSGMGAMISAGTRKLPNSQTTRM